jgi:hypothetical protein
VPVKPVPGDVVVEHVLLFAASIPGFVLGRSRIASTRRARTSDRAMNSPTS